MSTVTTRLGLTKPASIEQYNLATYNNNLDLIDGYVLNTADKLTKGRIGYNANNNTNVAGASSTMFDLVTVDLVNGRSYLVTYKMNHDAANANSPFSLNMKKSAVAVTDTTGTDVDTAWTLWSAPLGSSGKTDQASFTFKATTTEQVNIKAILIRAGATDVNISSRRLSVYDMGAQI